MEYEMVAVFSVNNGGFGKAVIVCGSGLGGAKRLRAVESFLM